MKTSLFLLGIISLITPAFAVEPATPPPPDRHLKIIQTSELVYPVELMREGLSHGIAKVVLHVNSQGQLVDSLVVAYTRQAFASEVERALKKWKFEPEYLNGEPIDAIVDVTFEFEVNGVLLVQKFVTELPFVEFVHGLGLEYQACSLKHLDRIPTPVSIVAPIYPQELAAQGISGKVVVDFYIDETGKVRFAAAAAAAPRQLIDIAVSSVQKWQFAPPTRKGSPVLVHAQQIFDFRKEIVATK